MPLTLRNRGISQVSGYAGPGDVVSGAVAWWGLRAYTRDETGVPIIRLRRDSDNAESDFNSLVDGGLDIASITAFKGGANLFVTTVYDQIGSADLFQNTAVWQLAFSLSALNQFPGMQFVAADTDHLLNSGITAQAQPFMISTVYNNNNDTGSQSSIVIQDVGVQVSTRGSGANVVSIYAGVSGVNATATLGNPHAVQATFNDAASEIYVDGAGTAGDLDTTNGLNTNGLRLGSVLSQGQQYGGLLFELGYWGGVWTAQQKSDMNANQHSYYGF